MEKEIDYLIDIYKKIIDMKSNIKNKDDYYGGFDAGSSAVYDIVIKDLTELKSKIK